jgi:hypothetical protein
MTGPQGTPGRFTFGCGTFHAILDRHGSYWWQSQSGHWYEAPPRAALMIEPRFEADEVPAWVEACTHDPVCFTESGCTALLLEEPRDD